MCPHGNRKARLQAIHRKVPVSALLFGIRMAKVPWEIYETISPLPLIPNRVLSSMPPRLRPDSPAWRDEEIAPRTNSWAEISDGCYASNKARVPRRTDTTLVVAHNEVYNTAISPHGGRRGLARAFLGQALGGGYRSILVIALTCSVGASNPAFLSTKRSPSHRKIRLDLIPESGKGVCGTAGIGTFQWLDHGMYRSPLAPTSQQGRDSESPDYPRQLGLADV
jgi:hypothetical protein